MSLALVMLTATALLAVFLLEAQTSQTGRLSPLLGRHLAQEARTIRLGYPTGESGASWFIVSPGQEADPVTRGGVELDALGFELAAEALQTGRPLLRSGRPWEAIRFAAPLEGSTKGEVAVAMIPPGVPRMGVLGLVLADCAVFTLLGAYLLRRRVVLPLRRLAEAARSIGEGGPGARVSVEGVGEAAEVAGAFNEMSEALERRSGALEKAVAELRTVNDSLRRARDGLDRAERLAAVGHLAAGVAHEVGNPMGAVLAFLDLVRRDEALSEESRGHLARALEQGERVRGILRQLLDFSRPPRASRTLVDLSALAEQTLTLVRAQRRFSGIEFELVIDEQPPCVLADSGLVGQILLNLVLNASAAAKSQPEPRVVVIVEPASMRSRAGEGRVDAAGRRNRDAVECRVEDSGPGVPEEDRERIFDPFFTTKPPGEGTGLGLANALRLAEELDGTLEYVASERLEGAAFSLRLPVDHSDGSVGIRAERGGSSREARTP
jgi:signal transduction histidine kinase